MNENEKLSKMANLSDFDSFHLIGKGSFGKVEHARKTNGEDAGTSYALKKMRLKYESNFNAEIEILNQANRHPFIVELFLTFTNEEYCFMVMEYVCGGTLWNVLQETPILSEEQASFYLKELVLALEYLHSKRIVYKDLKDSNTMLDATGHVKIIDFGLSVQLSHGEMSYNFCGTMDYMAPEILSETGHGLPVDWWSLGILAYKMTVGEMPFKESKTSSTRDAILVGAYDLPENLSPDLRDFLTELLESNVRKRLGYNGAEEVKNHKLFRSTCWEAVLQRFEISPILPAIANPHDISTLQPISDTSLQKLSFSEIQNEVPKSITKLEATSQHQVLPEKHNWKLIEDFGWKDEEMSDVFLKKKKRKNKKKITDYISMELNAKQMIP